MPISSYQAINSINTPKSFGLNDYSYYLLLVSGVAATQVGYMGLISTTNGTIFPFEASSNRVSIQYSGLKLTVNPDNLYVRIQLIRLKTV